MHIRNRANTIYPISRPASRLPLRHPATHCSEPSHRRLLPEGWPKPKGYSNGMAARGEIIAVAGQIGWDAQEKIVSTDFAAQTAQALRNIVAVLTAGGAKPEHIIRMTWYVVDLDEYNAARSAVGEAYKSIIGKHYPTMSLVKVAGLLEPGAKVEIEVTAVKPDVAG